MAAQMNDGHRRFLQTMMSHGILEGSEARALHRHCCETHKVYYAHDKLDEFINTINTQLQPMFMQIRKGKSEEDGRPHYALINLAETEITRMASDYAENELELFRKAMDLIVVSENGFASSTDILNLADQLQTKKMKKKEVEQVLQGFVQENWLCEKNGEYTLSTRCIMEMEQYIRNVYQDCVRMCNICHNIAIQSQMCESCGIKIHLPCVARYFRGRMDPRCPQCNDFWPHEIPEIRTAESHVSSSNSSTSSRERAAPSRTKRGR
ncbi:non-structural maintenance of chromosomes element 1 homolog isoform X1 [Latimeria chalumnae]|uniref:Non-structural maintenance of chromosomes element 1 homolog n=1 Tax=Latimeria chalumnae TaxID=7897 RepID=H3A814_LATCH|nr:PREDICTED: non-structural maintenance of chromosomes element 1 homolog isoform X1 [Latimeria chalumnae]XP_006011583.1 PREDICTED: non-structural maintenance of chromosomes element 1 homolog isoform X1 [Latimeria chalumnae]XP_006011584.1 PREDICTED: non-structural maintenance of chromosomes element 1 homolog isoform X1 [Latimeria chalumnae]XP_006011585.1 PREDICTED: non-structural maintenance of chromosomes element 1 homolog isoform X1 [Latimeria chalumnae]XP_006011586.1 PREDICTED: non-structura|eukprot:XP_006011582.1 PREDICTED: non-structural maintenance of chromosomes element 1 homolog isoform X1 [Latimeria chalumnae]